MFIGFKLIARSIFSLSAFGLTSKNFENAGRDNGEFSPAFAVLDSHGFMIVQQGCKHARNRGWMIQLLASFSFSSGNSTVICLATTKLL